MRDSMQDATQDAPGTEFWARHPDGTPVTRIADIIRRRTQATPTLQAMNRAGEAATFIELDTGSNKVANALIALGVVSGDRVMYLGPNGAAFVEVSYGAAKAGCVFAPVSHRLAAREIVEIVTLTEPAVLVVDADVKALVADLPAYPAGPQLFVVGEVAAGDSSYVGWRDAQPSTDPERDVGPDDTAVIMYSSGTTGLPKGVMLSGRNFACGLYTLNQNTELNEDSVSSAPIPFFHISGYGQLLAANLNGARMMLDQPSSPHDLLAFLVEQRVSHAMLVPTVIQTLLSDPAVETADLSALKYVMYGAAPMPAELLERATSVLRCKFLQSYGLTESTGGFTILTPQEHLDGIQNPRQLRSTGRAMPGARIRVVDRDTLADVPVGQHGEVLVAGPRVMKGYWRNPEETAKVIVQDGWLRTGDGGSFDEDGFLYLHDRIKDLIVSGGENIYPAEIERAIAEHPDVAEVAVVGMASAKWGESPFAFVVARADALTEADVLTWTRERLARFKCPVGVAFVDELPRTATGKVQRAKLRARVPAPV